MGVNLHKHAKFVELNILCSELRDTCKRNPLEKTDPEYKTWRSRKTIILTCLRCTMISEVQETFLFVELVKGSCSQIHKSRSKKKNAWSKRIIRQVEGYLEGNQSLLTGEQF